MEKVVFKGRLYDINRALQVLTYWPDLNWNNGIDVINCTVTSLYNTSLSSSELMKVQVHPVNDAPVLSLPGAIYSKNIKTGDQLNPIIEDLVTLYTVEDTPLQINGISIRDIDVENDDVFFQVNLTAVHGRVTILYENPIANFSLSNAVGSIGISYLVGSGKDDAIMVFMAPISIINTALSHIFFIPEENYFGIGARLIINVNDLGNTGFGGPKFDEKVFKFAISPSNDAPSVVTPTQAGILPIFLTNEGDIIRIDGAYPTVEEDKLSQTITLGDGSVEYIGSRLIPKRSWQSGFELWRLLETQYATASGSTIGPGLLEWSTRQVADINLGFGHSNPSFFKSYNGFLYYQADDGIHGKELWRDNGVIQDVRDITKEHETSTIAQQFVDLVPGKKGSNPEHLEVFNGYLYFSSQGIDTNWMSLPDRLDTCNSFRQSTFDPKIYFAVAEDNVWNPKRVYDCPYGYHWASTEEGYRYFTNQMETTSDRFWHAEGGAEVGESHGKQEYDALEYNPTLQKYEQKYEQSTTIERFSSHELRTYQDQCGWDSYTWNNKKRVHFRFSDSHITGAYKHAGRRDSYRPDVDTIQTTGSLWTSDFAGIVCIAGDDLKCETKDCRDLGAGQELWRTDGTTEGTFRLDDIYGGSQGSNPSYLTAFQDKLYFVATTNGQGRELWRTAGGITQAEIVPLSGQSIAAASGIYPDAKGSDPKDLAVAGNYLFFGATSPTIGRELWFVLRQSSLQSDLGSVDIVPGSASSNPNGFASSGGTLPVYFQATDATNGAELWKSDGTASGTVLVTDICAGKGSSFPKYLTWYKSKLYFQANDCILGIELWVYNPTAGTTNILKDIRYGAADSGPSYFAPMVSKLDGQTYLYFIATDGYGVSASNNLEGYGGAQIWVTDGTSSGTRRAFFLKNCE